MRAASKRVTVFGWNVVWVSMLRVDGFGDADGFGAGCESGGSLEEEHGRKGSKKRNAIEGITVVGAKVSILENIESLISERKSLKQ